MTQHTDALSAVLRMVRLRATVYFVREMPAPWGIDIPRQPHGPLHLVLEGSCLIEHEGRAVRLEPGDAVLFPDGAAHTVRDRAETRPVPAAEISPRLMNGAEVLDAPPATRLLCGHFERDKRFDHSMFLELPQMLLVRDAFDPRHATGLGAAVTLLASEAGEPAPGASVVADRMGEVLFVQVLRAWLAAQAPSRGILAAMADTRLSRALRHIHEQGHSGIDLEGLARVAGMSRTSFALRFGEVMDTTPAAYLTGWRMLQAREMLALTELPLAAVAEQVGYAAEAGFLKAFKRECGQNPGTFRRRMQADGAGKRRAAGQGAPQ